MVLLQFYDKSLFSTNFGPKFCKLYISSVGLGQPRVHLGADPGVADGLGLMEGRDIYLTTD